MDIVLVGLSRELPWKGFKPTLTCNFTVCEGERSTHAEVIFPDGGEEILHREGRDAKKVARNALERLLAHTAKPFSSLLFVRIPPEHAAYFAKHGDFHGSLAGVNPAATRTW